jgi:antibiotic biosynthesis monooxygenase (ABM) superfamily enzyme
MPNNTKENDDNKIVALICKAEVNSADTGYISDTLVKLMILGGEYPGFISADISPPSRQENCWTLIQRFYNSNQIANWQLSKERKKLIDEMASQYINHNWQFSEKEIWQDNHKGNAAIAIVNEIKPEMEKEYQNWEIKIKSWQARFPGYKGTFIQAPTESTKGRWTTLLHFESPDDLDNWFNSKERKALLPETKQFIKSTDFRHMTSSFPGWFPINANTGRDPARWKTTMLVLLSLYPIASLLIKYFRPLLTGLPVVWINFCSNIVSVTVMAWIVMPIALRAFKFWLYPKSEAVSVDLKGFLIVLGLYMVETALLAMII